MDLTILGVLALAVIVASSVLAPKMGVAAPLVLVGAGVLLALVPGVPRIDPEPELILAGVLPPLLYAASVNMPAMDFRRDLKSIGWLSIVVVISSALAIGWVVDVFVPGLGFAEGVALGAIVSPTDAVATSIVKRTGVAPRLVTVLEGESMINDASALVLLRAAVAAAAAAASVSVVHVSADFVSAIAVAVLVGLVVGAISVAVRARLHDATVNTAISFAVPFIAYAPAEHLGASGLVAVVTTGLVTGYWGPSVLRAQDRMAEAVNWRTIAFLLESGVFLLMGLEIGPLVDDFREQDGSFTRLAALSAICLGILLVVRSLYVAVLLWSLVKDRQTMRRQAEPRMSRVRDYLASDESKALPAHRLRRIHQMVARRESDLHFYETERLDRRAGVVLIWAGMRGSVTLAAAQTLPTDFAQRELLILVAFTVAVTSLLVQGGSLAWVVRRLGVESDRGDLQRPQVVVLSAMLADVAAARCDDAMSGVDGRVVEQLVIEQVRDDSHVDRATRWAGDDGDGSRHRLRDYAELRRAVLADQREALIDARASGRFDSEILTGMLRRVDAGDMAVDRLE